MTKIDAKQRYPASAGRSVRQKQSFKASILLLFGISLTLSPAFAQAQEFDIDAGPAVAGLSEFAAQADVSVVYTYDAVDGLETNKVEGVYEPDQALQLLLAGTGLSVYEGEGGAFAVATRDGRGDSDSKNLNPAPVLMAQNQTSQTRTTSNRSEDGEAEVSSEEDGDDHDTRGQIETIVVVGSRNAGIRRYEDDAQPYVIFESSEIEKSFALNVEDFLKYRLPQNASRATFSQEGTTSSGNRSEIDLRGLGADETLILVNGRRMPSVPAGTLFRQPDLNGIPLSAIERIEVLPSTAAGIYGGGATGGAINVILKHDYVGFEALAEYGNTFDSDVSHRRLEVSAGFSLFDGKTNVLLTGSRSESNPLLVADRDFVRRGRDLLIRNDAESIFSSFFPPLGSTTNIRSADGTDLILDDGQSVGSPFAHVPLGYSGAASDNGAAFLGTGGRYNLGLPDILSGNRASLLNNPVVTSYSAIIRHALSDNFEVFLDAGRYTNEGRVLEALDSNIGFISGNAPTNPFQNSVWIRYPVPNVTLPGPQIVETETDRVFAGGTLKFARDWSGQLEIGSSSATTYGEAYIPALVGVESSVSSGVLDVFFDWNEFPIDLSPFALTSPGLVQGPWKTEMLTASLRVTGPIYGLTSQPIMLSSLVEFREEKKPDSFQDRTSFSGVRSSIFFPELKQDVLSAYVEALVPLIPSADTHRNSLLELQIAARHDRYDTTGLARAETIELDSRDDPRPDVDRQDVDLSSTDFTIGLRLQPSDSILLRASYATGFIAPSLDQIAPFVSTSNNLGASLIDPRRGNVAGTNTLPIEIVSNGNPNLDPEDSKSLSAGLILSPKKIPGLRFSVDYTKIEKNDEIAAALTFSNIFDFEDQFPDRVTRLPLTPEDIDQGYTGGEIVKLDRSFLNVAKTTLEALDFQVNYEFETQNMGDFEVYAVGTNTRSFESQILSDSDAIDRVGFSDGPLEWRSNVGVNWRARQWQVGWNMQYFDSYIVHSSSASPALSELIVRQQGSAKIPSQSYHDLYISFDVTAFRMLNSLQLNFGIQNLFDEDPPILATMGTTGGYSTFGDPRLRRFSFQVRAGF